MPAAIFGIENDALNLAANLVILFLVVLWLALIAWTYFDARRRIEDQFLVACATAASIFPYVGTVVYSILRPPEFLADRHERGLEIRASELRVRQLEEQSCPNCGHPVERTYLRCPSCRARIKDPCESCGKPIDPRWSICPYCETPVRRAAPPERRPQAARARAARQRPREDPRQPATDGGKPSAPAPARQQQRPPAARTATRPARSANQRTGRPPAQTRKATGQPRKGSGTPATDG
jgi:Double zinc ribbon